MSFGVRNMKRWKRKARKRGKELQKEASMGEFKSKRREIKAKRGQKR
jgi:hypothetical protein